ncbi:MAG: hypothetical protein Q8933_22105 [Bacteroidota bacterium]|nr:hypothetical protein [Bacteroidota bacterium]
MRIHSDFSGTHYRSMFDALQLNAAYFPVHQFGLEARVGGELSDTYYSGFDLGLITKYYFLPQSPNLYLLGGIMFHSNAEGGGMTFSVNENIITMPAIGLGINAQGPFYLEALFQFGMNQDIASDTDITTPNWTIHKTKLDWILKLGAGFSWSL